MTEWEELFTAIGDHYDDADKLRDSSWSGTDDYGFSAIANGQVTIHAGDWGWTGGNDLTKFWSFRPPLILGFAKTPPILVGEVSANLKALFYLA